LGFRDTGRGDLRGAERWKKRKRRRKRRKRRKRRRRRRRKKIYPRPLPPRFQGSACREVKHRRMVNGQ